MKTLSKYILLLSISILFHSCSNNFTNEQEQVLKEFLNTSFYGQSDTKFSEDIVYNYARLSFELSKNKELKFTYRRRSYSSFANIIDIQKGNVELGYDNEGNFIEIKLYNEEGTLLPTIEFKIDKDSIVPLLSERLASRKLVKDFKDKRKIKQARNSNAEAIERLDEKKYILSPLWSEDYKKSRTHIGSIFINDNAGSIKLIEEYDESLIQRTGHLDGKFTQNIEKEKILHFFKEGFRIFDTNIYEMKDILLDTSIYAANPRAESKLRMLSNTYVNEFGGESFNFLFGKVADIGFYEKMGSIKVPSAKQISMNSVQVIDKFVGLEQITEYNAYGLPYDTWYLDVIVSTSSEEQSENIIDRYAIFEVTYGDKDYLYLSKWYFKSPIQGLNYALSGGSYNNDYIIIAN